MGTVGPVVINHPCMLCCRPTSMWCSRCRNAWYCTPEHLHTDWPRHCRECIPATYAQNYNMTATPLLAGQQAITRSTTLLEPEEATSISSMEPSAPYNMVSLADSRALMSGIPSFCKSAVIAVKDHGLHADVPNRRSYTLLDGVPVHPEAHRQPTQMQFANCLPSPCSYSDPNSREPPEPIRHGAAPYNFQDVHIIETSTRDVEVGCKQQALGCKLTRDNDIHHMLEFHDNKMLKHHSGPPSASITHAVDNQIDEYSTCPAIRCLCTGSDGRECLQYINCGVVPAHFKDAHNIKHLTRRRLLDCTW